MTKAAAVFSGRFPGAVAAESWFLAVRPEKAAEDVTASARAEADI